MNKLTACSCLIAGLLPALIAPLSAQDEAAQAPITARLYYENADPRLIFQMLSETYHIQFDQGADAVTQPITLITPEQSQVDLQGMLTLLNDALRRESLTAQLDGQIVRIVPLQDTLELWISLQHAQPDQIVAFLQDLYLSKPDDRPEDRSRRAQEIKAHPQLQQIMVVGPTEVVRTIEKMVVEKLDLAPQLTPAPSKPGLAPVQRRYFTLDYMDADEFQKLLEQDASLSESFAFTLAVAPNNTLIAASRDEAFFARVDELRKTFDVDKMEIRYIKLSNANPKEVANLLRKIYPAEAQPLPAEIQRLRRRRLSEPDAPIPDAVNTEFREALDRAGLTEMSVEDLLSPSLSIIAVGEMTIVEDIPRSALLIRTFSRNFPKILELIQELDKPRDQVLIDVFITEVNLDDNVEFGVDFTYNDDTIISGQNRDYTLTQTTGAADISLGLSYQLISDNITALISALAQSDQLNLVTRPQIVTKDNAQAEIVLGRDVPIVRNTKVSTEGAISSEVAYNAVTTHLKVTPHIHPNDYITLDIEQLIDDISTETFQISENFNPQVIIRRRAKTNLRVKDGQTICLGGFVQDRTLEMEKGIPLLKDIPLLGYLFRYTSVSRVKQELIIFITPHILVTPQDMLRMTNDQRSRSSATLEVDQGREILEVQEQLHVPRYREGVEDAPDEESDIDTLKPSTE